MAGKIETRLKNLKNEGRRALVPFFTAGYPDMKTSGRMILAAIDAGADLVEIGVPFSDPIADGPSIQYSSQRALKNGMTLNRVLQLAGAVSKARPGVPLVIMSYFNPIHAFGLQRFLKVLPNCGVSGLIIPDLSVEAFKTLEDHFRAQPKVELVQLVSLTTAPERAGGLLASSRGFVYVVGDTGVTGARSTLPEQLPLFVGSLRFLTELSLFVGFGISTPEMAHQVTRFADGAIVGSAVIDVIRANEGKDPIKHVSEFLKQVRAAIDIQ